MNERSVLSDVLEKTVNSIAESFEDNVPFHRFSLRYKRNERSVLKAYFNSVGKQKDIAYLYNRLSLRHRIRLAVIIILAVLFLAGFTVFITHYIGNIRIDEYVTHSFVNLSDKKNAPEELINKYVIGYDLSDWHREMLSDNEYIYWENYKKDNLFISFSYLVKSSDQGIRYNTEGSNIENRVIEDKNAVFYISPTGINCLVWDNGDCIMQFFYQNISYEKAIEIIKSIKAQ